MGMSIGEMPEDNDIKRKAEEFCSSIANIYQIFSEENNLADGQNPWEAIKIAGQYLFLEKLFNLGSAYFMDQNEFNGTNYPTCLPQLLEMYA